MKRIIATVVFLALLSCAAFATPVPSHGGKRVIDLAHVMSLAEVSRLNAKLADFEARNNKTQIAILVIDVIDEDPNAFANRVFHEWKLGDAKLDNGLLILFVTKKPRYCKIETGYGAEQYIPDGRAGEIIRTKISPNTKAGRYYAAFDAATNEVMRLLDGKFNAAPAQVSELKVNPPASAPANVEAKKGSGILFFLLIFVVAGFVLLAVIAAVAGTSSGGETPIGMRTSGGRRSRRRRGYDDDIPAVLPISLGSSSSRSSDDSWSSSSSSSNSSSSSSSSDDSPSDSSPSSDFSGSGGDSGGGGAGSSDV